MSGADGPVMSVLVLGAGDGAAESVRSVREQTLRAVEPVVATGLADGLAAARGRRVVVLRAGETLERNACRNLWEAAERTGAGLVAGRWVRPDRPGGPPREQPWRHEVFGRSAVLGSAAELPGLRESGALSGGWCADRALLDPVPAPPEGETVAARAGRIAVVPQLLVHRPAPAPAASPPPADGGENRLTRCAADPVRTGVLHLAGRLPDPFVRLPAEHPRRAALVLRPRRGTRRLTLPLTVLHRNAGVLHWRAEVDTARALRPWAGAGARWDLGLAVRAGGAEEVTFPAAEVPPGGGPLLPARPRPSRLVGDTWRPAAARDGRLTLLLEARAPASRRVRRQARRLRPSVLRGTLRRRWRAALGRLRSGEVKLRVYHGLLCRLPMRRGTVVLESHMGKQYGDSPRALYEEIRRRGLPVRCYWSYAGSPEGFPAHAVLVRRWSYRYLAALARAEFWIDNQGFPQKLRKPSRVTYVQTWHGSAFKRMGADEARVRMLGAASRHALQAAVDRFDHFLVRGEHDVRTLARAYRLPEEKLLRLGYPRNDRLVSGAPAGERLGIPPGRQIVLYAPTFRGTGSRTAPGELLLDAERFAARFGGEKVLLVRAHYLDRFRLPPGADGTVRDVSGLDDVTALLALADVLVTDYSSVMFDYALLDRPMIFYTPDLDEYTASRGSYFDLRSHAPGPLAESEDALFRALEETTVHPDPYAAARRRFAAEFGGYDTGDAAAAVVDRFFGGSGR